MLRTCQSLTTRWSLPEVIISGRALQCTIIDSCFSLLENHVNDLQNHRKKKCVCHFCPSKMKVRFFLGCRITSISQKKNSSDHLMGGFWRPENHQGRIQPFGCFRMIPPKMGFYWDGWNMVKHDNSTKKSEKTPWNHMMWFTMIQFDSASWGVGTCWSVALKGWGNLDSMHEVQLYQGLVWNSRCPFHAIKVLHLIYIYI